MIKSFLRLTGLFGAGVESAPKLSANRYPQSLQVNEQSRWRHLVIGEKDGENDLYFQTMALAYACATKKLDSAEYLMEKMGVPPSGTFGMVDDVLYATIDYHSDPSDQVEIAKLLKKYDINFSAWDLDKHNHEISKPLWHFMFPDAPCDDDFEMPHIANVSTYLLKGQPFVGMSSDAIRTHMNVLALSYAMLKEMPAEAEFLIRARNTPVGGEGLLVGEPLRATITGQSDRMKVIAATHGVTIENAIDPDIRFPK